MKRRNRLRVASVWLAASTLLVALVVSTACRRDPQAGAQTVNQMAANQTSANQAVGTRTVTIPVDGMICQVCAGTVKSALKKVAGVNEAEISLEKRHAVVHFDGGKASLEALTRAIKDAGFKPGEPSAPQSQ